MSVRKLTRSLLTALAMFGGMTLVNGQERVPVEDPLAFDPDFHWFEPVYDMDLADMKPSKRASEGWFASYDRLNLYGSRPEINDSNVSETLLDSGYGHRYEIGYMVPDKENGWLFNWTTSEAGQSSSVHVEALNRYNLNSLADPDTGTTGPPFGELVPQVDQNNRGFNTRFYDVSDSENVFTLDTYELNKVWRLEPYHYGGILEPILGVRWMQFDDHNFFQNYESTFEAIPLVGPFGAAERLTTNQALTENNMLGGQVGFRYFKFRDRFTFSTDFRAFAGSNFQSSRAQTLTETTIYNFTANTVTIGQDSLAVDNTATTPIYTRNEEFFIGFDVRGEVGYQLTKLITVRAGFQVLDIGRGLWRGGPSIASGRNVLAGGDNDQDFQQVGYSFGLTLNR